MVTADGYKAAVLHYTSPAGEEVCFSLCVAVCVLLGVCLSVFVACVCVCGGGGRGGRFKSVKLPGY